MRALPPSLALKLASGVTTIAQAWRLTRADGLIVAVTAHDRDLMFAGTLFLAAHSLMGGDNEQSVTLAADRTALSGALSIAAISQSDLVLGRWNQAKVEAFLVDWTHPADHVALWTGIVEGVSWRGTVFELDVVAPETRLNRDIGRVYARTCDAVLGDTHCKVDLAAPDRTFLATIASIVSERTLTIAVPVGKTANDFVGGVLTVVTGPASTWICDVARIETSALAWTLYLARPVPVAPIMGDAVKLSVGCDKTFVTCKARFANALNFRGQPTLPGDDVAFSGPAVAGNNGGKR